MAWTYGRDVTSDFDRAESLEWLETNGLGGWASSTVGGAHSRRYHGMLVAATSPPVGRMVLVSRLDETVVTAEASFELAANRFPGAVHPDGHLRIERFRRGLFPSWEYRAGPVRLRKTVACINGENTTVVRYEVLEAPGRFRLRLRPFFAGRDYHTVVRANAAVQRRAAYGGGVLVYRAYEDVPAVFLGTSPVAGWYPEPDWWHDFEFARERERGLEFREDLFTPGSFAVALEPGGTLGVVLSTSPVNGTGAAELLERERRRREALLARAGTRDGLSRALVLAADQFVVRRGDGQRTVIAGYPWFTDWGRDTMIALPGLCLATGRHEEARRILRTFASATDRGMLPNRFPDGGADPEYNTVDAGLWFFVACLRYVEATGDARFARDELLPVLREIVLYHRRGTRHGIRETPDGLLRVGEPGVQLTWMDARVGDHVVTPRHGKPVEINALWYNALRTLAELERRFGDGTAVGELELQAARVARSYVETFWVDDDHGLADVVEDDGRRDTRVRPNQIFALSLPFPLLEGPRAEAVLRVVERDLLTPVGLRSLAPGDPAYRGRYQGDVPARDGAYHQGTVWSWLLGPFLTALVRVRGETGRRRARKLLAAFSRHLGEAGIGSVSEIFDGDPPHLPRGCPAQAWSVGEILRAALEPAVVDRVETEPAGAAR